MALKDQISLAKAETKEKIIAIQFLDKDKDSITKQLDTTCQTLKKFEEELNQV